MCHSFIQLRYILIYWGLCLPNQGFLHSLAREHLSSFHYNEKEISEQETILREYHPPLILFFKIILFMNLFLAVLGLCCWADFSLGVMRRLQGAWASVVAARGLSSCASQALEHRLRSCAAWAQLLCAMWDLPGPGIEPVSPALADRFPTTEPPGKHPPPLFSFKSNGQTFRWFPLCYLAFI